MKGANGVSVEWIGAEVDVPSVGAHAVRAINIKISEINRVPLKLLLIFIDFTFPEWVL